MLCGLATVPLGCGERAIRECEALVEGEQNEQAAMNCEQAYRATNHPRAGLLAAQALRRLGRADEVAQWVDRLAGSEEEAAVARLAGRAFTAAGRLEEARRVLEREHALRLAAGDAEEIARTSYRLAYLAWRVSDYRGAFAYTAEAYDEALRADNQPLAAKTLELLGAVLFEIGDLDAARRALEEASTLGLDAAGEIRVEVTRGLLHLRAGRPRIARAAFEGVLAEERDPGPRVARAAHDNLVEATLALGDLEAARRHVAASKGLFAESPADEALLLALEAKVEAAEGDHAAAVTLLDQAIEASPSPDQLQEILFDRGSALEALGRDGEAMAEYRRAIELIEESRRSLGSDDYKEWLLERRRRPFERLLELLVRSGQPMAALATAESIKARTFLDSFTRATEDPAQSPAPGAAGVLARRGGERLEALSSLLPALRESPVAAFQPTEEVVRMLSGRQVLFFLEVSGEVWRLHLDGEVPSFESLAVTVEQVTERVDELIAEPGRLDVAAALGASLLSDLELPPPGGRIEVVADGALGRLPFAAIRHRGRFLVEDYEIAYAPSLTALVAIEARPWRGGSDALILADPLGDLPAAAAEATEIGDLLGGEPVLGRAATFGSLDAAPGPRLVHFATHTSLDVGGPSLVLADRTVRAVDILDHHLDPGIVVLATCASASRRGQGLWGSMGAAFLASGARAVIASLWSLDDRVAREFVLRFYREGGLEDPSRALAETQRAFIASGRGLETWAPFVLLGSARAVTPSHQVGGES